MLELGALFFCLRQVKSFLWSKGCLEKRLVLGFLPYMAFPVFFLWGGYFRGVYDIYIFNSFIVFIAIQCLQCFNAKGRTMSFASLLHTAWYLVSHLLLYNHRIHLYFWDNVMLLVLDRPIFSPTSQPICPNGNPKHLNNLIKSEH